MAILAVVFGLIASGLAGPVRAQDGAVCGSAPVTIAAMPWPSGALLAHIHALILKEHYGCAVEVVPGDLGGTATAMTTTGRPMVAPELWIDRVARIWNAGLGANMVRAAGPSYEGGALEGWYVPSYVIADNPGLKSIADLGAHWKVFRAQGAQEASFLSCPADWACSVINANLIRALGLSKRFEIEVPANRYQLDQALAGAISRHAPVLAYYWQPNAVIAQLDLKPLAMGAYDADAAKCLAERDCADPRPSAFVAEPVVTAVSAELFANAPVLAAYFQRAQMPLAEMNALLAWQVAQNADPATTAAHFLQTGQAIWAPWVGGG